jgi:hypothetical protein
LRIGRMYMIWSLVTVCTVHLPMVSLHLTLV